MANALQHEKSLYLLQHANNPVNWVPWNKLSLSQAESSQKLIIVSIGYSSCHWCHVMEHECFEDRDVAQVMNRNFINIKVDREQHPDVDQYYMRAMQLMTRQGGWPLNCVCLPDGRPIWCATYLPKDRWIAALIQLQGIYEEEPQQILDYADKLSDGIAQSELIQEQQQGFSETELQDLLKTWQGSFDFQYGGYQREPKFPLPNSWETLLNIAAYTGNQSLLEHVENTCLSLVNKGIYDQLNGGWFRYSTDSKWHIPHFEKMLYDNAQLLSLIAQAFRKYKTPVFKKKLEQTIQFLQTQFKLKNGLYQAALDADTEGEEGKYYTFNLAELKTAAEEHFNLFKEYFGIAEENAWEGKFHLHEFDKETAASSQQFTDFFTRLRAIQAGRTKPEIDYKCLLSWNALLLSGLCNSYKAIQEQDLKLKCTELFKALEQFTDDENVYHSIIGGERIGQAYADGLCFYAKACLDFFSISGSPQAYKKCLALTERLEAFWDEEMGLYKFSLAKDLINQAFYEREDNVINAVNSSMAWLLLKISALEGENRYYERVMRMLRVVKSEIHKFPGSYAHWIQVAWESLHLKEKIVVGKQAEMVMHQTWKNFEAFQFECFTSEPSDLPPFKGRERDQATWIYLCKHGVCDKPKMINFKRRK